MKKATTYFLFALFLLTLTSFSVHKFYVAVYQINYVSDKKMLQVTSRIFIDDLTKTLEKQSGKKCYLATEKESVEDVLLLKKYFSEHFTIKVNGQLKTMLFLSKENEADVLICYCSIKEITKITSLEINNTVLTDWNSDQQNIVHINALGTKKTLLFTDSNKVELLKY